MGRSLACFALSAALLAAPATGQTPASGKAVAKPKASIEQAMQAIDAQDFEKALALLAPLTDKGDPEALYLRGLLNESGKVRGGSPEHAAAWYVKAAQAGSAKAQNNLGAMYYDGRGVAQNLAQARLWYGRSAEQGNPQAQLNYALMLGQGLGTDDPEKSRNAPAMLQWLVRASGQGYARAQIQLGRLYLVGAEGVPANTAEAVRWLRLAAEQDSAEAQYLLGQLLQKGEGAPRDLAAAITWFEHAATGPPSPSMASANYELGVIYELGLGTLADADRSASYYRRAAAEGNPKAIGKLSPPK
jgi:uncharacterized protein